MDLKQLSYFTAVVEEGTISAAARRLHLTQPPLSAQMKALEEEAGCVLFERGSRQIRLTAAGQMLYGRAQKMLELADITVRELQDYQEGTGGVLRLGVVSSIGSSFLTGAVCSFCTEHPQVNFELTEGNTYQLLDGISSGLIELAIVRSPFPEKGLISIPLLDEPLLAAGHQKYFSGKDSLTLADLKETPLILYRRWESILLEQFQSAGFQPRVFCKNDDARTSAAWADAGLGVAILPASASCYFHHPDSQVLPVEDLKLRSGICLVHSEGAYISAAARAFMQSLPEYVSGETPVAPS
ncbi:MAG: LysR family transcriptional regulator [Lachnospiraceae bacterium]|nr:LysR family transcriptional regulator [Lachnospiraceae bacterium]